MLVKPASVAHSLSIADEIARHQAENGVLILAQHFQDFEIQEVADHVGEGMELAQRLNAMETGTVAFCGGRFMAETIKILHPRLTVLLPDLNAGCSLVDSCPAKAVRSFRERNPGHAIVSYLNTSADVKAESDIVCTAQNAVAIVNSIPRGKPLLFVPDSNLGNWVKQRTRRENMQVWQGACIVHATFPARRIRELRQEHPEALLAAHPECSVDVLKLVDFVGSPSAIVDWCARQSANEFIFATDEGLEYALRKRMPQRKFYFASSQSCNCSYCPYLRVNTLEKLLHCLQTGEPRIELPAEVMRKARIPLERMLAVDGMSA